ncbi:MAG TPA: lysophospholipid acyltransferase family protein [Labilithrix sp.]|nr:lysophospholipid acyltransferase family protein [Labilithrix sp.]
MPLARAFEEAAWDARVEPKLVRFARPIVRALARLHPLRFDGGEHLPQGPALLVGNHGVLGYESPFFFERVLDASGRLPIGLADRWFFRVPGLRDALVRLGGAYGCTRNALRALGRGELVVCYPGGVRETLKHERDKYRCLWRESLGFVRLAMTAGVPIIPFAAAGVDHTYRIVGHVRGSGLALMGNGKYDLPLVWGLGPLPRPVPFWFRIGKPIELPRVEAETEPLDESDIRDLHAEVWSRTQQMVDDLVEEWSDQHARSFPREGVAA